MNRLFTISIRHCATAQLTLKVPFTTAADDSFDFLIFHRKGVLADDSYEMSRLVISNNNKKKKNSIEG